MERWNFQPYIIEKKEPPKLPDTIEELNEILEKTHGRLKILEHGQMSRFGTTSECAVELLCPFCESHFTGHHSEGCFHSTTVPLSCPVCDFPTNIFRKLHELSQPKNEPWKFEATFHVEVKK